MIAEVCPVASLTATGAFLLQERKVVMTGKGGDSTGKPQGLRLGPASKPEPQRGLRANELGPGVAPVTQKQPTARDL